MKPSNLVPLLSLIILLSTCISCKKRMGNLDVSPDPDSIRSTEKVMLPVKIVYDRLTTTFAYREHTAQLTEIKKSTGYRYVFLYNNQHRLAEYQIYQGSKFAFFAQIARDAVGKITKIVKFDVDLVYGQTYFPKGFYTVEFNNKNQLVNVKDQGADKKLISETKMEYDNAGNITKIQTEYSDYQTTYKLSYDSKNGIYKNIADISLIFVVHKDIEMLGCDNNFLSYKNGMDDKDDRLVSYEYNTENYPVKMAVTRKSWKENHVITYMDIDSL